MMTPYLAVGYWKIAWFTFLCDRLSTTKKKLHAERLNRCKTQVLLLQPT